MEVIPGGAAVVAALGCAAGGVKYGRLLGPWGRCNRRNWRSSGLWIFSLYRYIIKMKAKFYEGYILYYSLRFSNLSYLSIHSISEKKQKTIELTSLNCFVILFLIYDKLIFSLLPMFFDNFILNLFRN